VAGVTWLSREAELLPAAWINAECELLCKLNYRIPDIIHANGPMICPICLYSVSATEHFWIVTSHLFCGCSPEVAAAPAA